MDRFLAAFYHFTFLFHAYNLYYNLAHVNLPGENFLTFYGYPGKLKYLTNWNYFVATIYFGLVCLHLSSNRVRLKRLVDLLHATLVFPFGFLVCSLFWGISAVDPESISTYEIRRRFQPAWNDHAMHTLPVAFVVADAFLVKHDYPSDFFGLSVVSGVASFYIASLLYLGLGPSKLWAYPVLEKLSGNATDLTLFFIGCFIAFVLEYYAGKGFTLFFWHRKTSQKIKD